MTKDKGMYDDYEVIGVEEKQSFGGMKRTVEVEVCETGAYFKYDSSGNEFDEHFELKDN